MSGPDTLIKDRSTLPHNEKRVQADVRCSYVNADTATAEGRVDIVHSRLLALQAVDNKTWLWWWSPHFLCGQPNLRLRQCGRSRTASIVVVSYTLIREEQSELWMPFVRRRAQA